MIVDNEKEKARIIYNLVKTTKASVKDCRDAYEAAGEDFEKAIEIISKNAGTKIKRIDENASQYRLVAVAKKGENIFTLDIFALNDFSIKGDYFKDTVKAIMKIVSNMGTSLDLQSDIENNGEIKSLLENFKVHYKEAIRLGKAKIYRSDKGQFCLYVHSPMFKAYEDHTEIYCGNKSLSIVEIEKNKDVSEEAKKNVCIQVIYTRPEFISLETIDHNIKEEKRKSFYKDAIESKKNPDLIDKIVEGQLEKFFKQKTLLDQPFFKDDSCFEQYCKDENINIINIHWEEVQ